MRRKSQSREIHVLAFPIVVDALGRRGLVGLGFGELALGHAGVIFGDGFFFGSCVSFRPFSVSV